MNPIPEYREDFYSDEFIADPWPHYARMRALGPVVWLPQHQNFALTHHSAVAAAVRDHETFISGKGVAADEVANEMTKGNSAASDGARHAAIRGATSVPLLPGALESVRGQIESSAEGLIESLLTRESFDAVVDFARHLPLTIVRDLVGLPDFGRDNMLRWANATFDLIGVQNERGRTAVETFLEQRKFAQTQAKPEVLQPGSWTRRLFDLVDQGLLAPDLAPVAMRDYLNPSLDTTISAISQLIYQLGMNPDQWQLLRQNPALMRGAANEAVRMASPVRSFVRHTSRDVEIAGFVVPEGARVMMVFASANRDEQVFSNPDKFDIERNPRHHLGFGSGIHMCVGQHLAQLEMISILKAMIPRVESIVVGRPVIALNNTIYNYGSLPATFRGRSLPSTSAARGARGPTGDSSKIAARILSCKMVAKDVVALTIAPLDDGALPVWSPGAHIDVHINDALVRQYSLTGPSRSDAYVIAVQREPQSRGGSANIHSSFGEGAAIMISKPRNHFKLVEDGSPVALFSGGIGLTPILSMAWRLHQLGQEFTWHVSAHDSLRVPWGSELKDLPFAGRIRLHLSEGPDASRLDAGKVVDELGEGTHIYICGPKRYIDSLHAAATNAGFDAEHIHREHFAAEIDVNGDPFTVIASRSGRAVPVGPGETILQALRRDGFHIESSCQNGVCGTCVTRLLEGRADHRDMVLTATEKAENSKIAVCCSRSQTPRLILDI
ncbi:cytochrome P450 [Mesorhizobium sp.]|uniref:cytochrome P450/oxidoreductase n=1 Tax=Mesorhizobium sp. TaxID=1871066 RepID=UPI0025EE183C|nr:cytochrome P450 [Mesorhizobium sp.]